MSFPDRLRRYALPPARGEVVDGFTLGRWSLPDSSRWFYEASDGLSIEELRTEVLSLAAAKKYGEAIASLPDPSFYGLLPITESNDSNPYCLIIGDRLNGAVMRLSHDCDTRVTHGSIQSFLECLASLLERGGDSIDGVAPEIVPDARLIADADAMINEELEDDGEALQQLIPVVAVCSPKVVVRLLSVDDMWMREEAALQCGRRGLLETRDALLALARDGDRQDNRAARFALAELQRRRGENGK